MCFPLEPVFTRDKRRLPNFIDEPTAGLDPKERVRLRNILSDFASDKIVLLSTHIVSDIEAIADEVFLMKKGTFILQLLKNTMEEYGYENYR